MSRQLQTQAKTGQKSSDAVPFGILQRAKRPEIEEEECRSKRRILQRRSANNDEVSEVPPIVNAVLRSRGQPLNSEVCAFFEARFGHDFSQVRVHTDPCAAESAQSVNAIAYTLGRDIIFDSGRYSPDSMEGRRLLAHEIAHVAQQRNVDLNSSTSIRLGAIDDSAESQAERAAASIDAEARSALPPSAFASTGVLYRQPAKARISTASRPWSARKDIAAGVLDLNGCWSMANAEGEFNTVGKAKGPYSTACSGRLCAKEPLSLLFMFHVDGDAIPRPPPFEKSRAALKIIFIPAMGGERPLFDGISEAAYTGVPGAPLQTSFGVRVPFVPPEPGTLRIHMIHADRSSGEVAVYSDEIPIVDCPKVAKKLSSNAVLTGIYVVVPDPKNAPSVNHRLTKQDGLDQSGVIVEVERDGTDYFYRIEGQKYYLSERP